MTEQANPARQLDHDSIRRLISRFFRALDERKFDGDWARDHCTEDIRTATPAGVARGEAAIRQSQEAVEWFDRTQHIATDILVDVAPAGDRATASWNALMTHVHRDSTLRSRGSGANPLLTVGGYCGAELRRTEEGWRISQLSIEPIWSQGDPPPAMEQPRTVAG